MRAPTQRLLAAALGLAVMLTPCASALAASTVADSTWVDHHRQAIPQPPNWQPTYWGQRFHQALVDPLSHLFDIPDKLLWGARALGAETRREAVDVNAFDEAPNSAWFTNRNHVRSVPVESRTMRSSPLLTHGK
jgi:hypothetical protein